MSATDRQQAQLFPLRIAYTFKPPNASADLTEYAHTQDGHDWAVKWPEDGPGIPGSEWFGYRLAQACQIATPLSAMLTDAVGRLGFGSRIEYSASQFSRLQVAEKMNIIASCRQPLSAAVALDIFTGNSDRHLDNWLFVKNTTNQWAPLCIDFSRALFAAGFPGDQIPMQPCHTLTTQRRLKAANCWDGPFATFCVDAIQNIAKQTVERWLLDCPEQWIPAEQARELVSWWGSAQYHSRLQSTLAQL